MVTRVELGLHASRPRRVAHHPVEIQRRVIGATATNPVIQCLAFRLSLPGPVGGTFERKERATDASAFNRLRQRRDSLAGRLSAPT